LIPLLVAAVAAPDMVVVMGLWILEPNVLRTSSSLEIGFMAVILVGSLVVNFLPYAISQIERPRFGS
jgi:hypothetical protein